MRIQLVMIAVASWLAGPAAGAVFSCDEAGLDAAIAAAEAGDPGPHRLDCAFGDEIPFTGRRLLVADLVLDGQGATTRCMAVPPGAGCGSAFVMNCEPGVCDEPPIIELRNLTLPGSMGVRGRPGGGVGIGRADVTLRNVLVTGEGEHSSSGVRMGSLEGGALHLIESSVVGCADGVSVFFGGSSMTIERSLIAHNDGIGVLLSEGATGELVDSTVSNNGSGVRNAGTLAIVNSTIAGNEGLDYSDVATRVRCFERGESLFLPSTGDASSTNSIIEGECSIGSPSPFPTPDTSGYVDVDSAGYVEPDACIPPPLPGTMTSTGGNVESPGDTCRFTDPSDQVGVSVAELALGPLQDNGGPTDTHALRPGSVAIDAGVLGNCTPTDQRGVERPQGAGCDAGAYEVEFRVEVDIKPGSHLNPINPLSRGVIPVAILGSETFDVAEIDVTTLAFGPAGAPPKHKKGGHPQDVNDDGLTDLVSHYRTPQTGIVPGDTGTCVTGETLDGMPFEGCDSILALGPCGLGFELAFLLAPLMWLRSRRRSRPRRHQPLP